VGDIAGGRPHTCLARSGHSHEIGMATGSTTSRGEMISSRPQERVGSTHLAGILSHGPSPGAPNLPKFL